MDETRRTVWEYEYEVVELGFSDSWWIEDDDERTVKGKAKRVGTGRVRSREEIIRTGPWRIERVAK